MKRDCFYDPLYDKTLRVRRDRICREVNVDLGLILKLYLITRHSVWLLQSPNKSSSKAETELFRARCSGQSRQKHGTLQQCILSCPVLFCDVSRRWHVPTQNLCCPHSSLAFLFTSCVLCCPFSLLFSLFFSTLGTMTFLSLSPVCPLMTFFLYSVSLSLCPASPGCPFSSVSPSVSSSASVPPHPLSRHPSLCPHLPLCLLQIVVFSQCYAFSPNRLPRERL